MTHTILMASPLGNLTESTLIQQAWFRMGYCWKRPSGAEKIYYGHVEHLYVNRKGYMNWAIGEPFKGVPKFKLSHPLKAKNNTLVPKGVIGVTSEGRLIENRNDNYQGLLYGNHHYVSGRWRYATKEEIKLYNTGIYSIKNIITVPSIKIWF